MCGVHIRFEQVPNVFVREANFVLTPSPPEHAPLCVVSPGSVFFSLVSFFVCKLECFEISQCRYFKRVSSQFLPTLMISGFRVWSSRGLDNIKCRSRHFLNPIFVSVCMSSHVSLLALTTFCQLGEGGGGGDGPQRAVALKRTFEYKLCEVTLVLSAFTRFTTRSPTTASSYSSPTVAICASAAHSRYSG